MEASKLGLETVKSSKISLESVKKLYNHEIIMHFVPLLRGDKRCEKRVFLNFLKTESSQHNDSGIHF